uniref:Proteasome subunit beta n=1 Tax=Romanomermis culicivorax TaxID=13658 RepID=A0A915IM23_ROMCU
MTVDLNQANNLAKNPVNTGTSVLAIKFDGGVAMAADTLASFGSMARYGKVSRIFDANRRTLLGVSGDYADFQYLKRHLQAKIMDDQRLDDTHEFNPSAIYNWLSCVLYDRRSEFNPLFNQYVIGGLNKMNGETKPFLGTVNKLGVTYESSFIVSGLGNFMVQQILENEYKKVKSAKSGDTLLTKKEAVELLRNCMTILFYRDARAHTNISAEYDGFPIRMILVVLRWEKFLLFSVNYYINKYTSC